MSWVREASYELDQRCPDFLKIFQNTRRKISNVSQLCLVLRCREAREHNGEVAAARLLPGLTFLSP